MRVLGVLLVVLLLALGVVFVIAGRMDGPAIVIEQPEKFVGAATPLKVVLTAPCSLDSVDNAFGMEGQRTAV